MTWDPTHGGWNVVFRSVLFPGADKPKRVRFNHAPQIGRFDTKELAERCLTIIRQRAMGQPLNEVLVEYMPTPPPQAMVPHRWRHQFVEAKRVEFERGNLSHERFRHLRDLPNPGYLDFWRNTPVGRIDGPGVVRWYKWLLATYPALQASSIRHIVRDFKTFCYAMKGDGALLIVPQFPLVRVKKRARSVPDRVDVDRILAAIPARERGLWLARGYAGLRPSEARRVNVADYRDGVLILRPEIVKTNEPRPLDFATVAPEVDAWIREHRTGADPWEPLFNSPRARDGRWRETPERRVWAKALLRSGLLDAKPNDAGRHSFATHEAHGGTDLKALQEWLGHVSLKTTELYLHMEPQRLARRMRPVPGPELARTNPKRKSDPSKPA